MHSSGSSITPKEHVRRIYALKRIIHMPKAHGTQEPEQYALYSEFPSTAQRTNSPKKCIYRSAYYLWHTI